MTRLGKLALLLAVPFGSTHCIVGVSSRCFGSSGVCGVSLASPSGGPCFLSSFPFFQDEAAPLEGGVGGIGDDSGGGQRGEGVLGEVGVVVAAAEPLDSKKSKAGKLRSAVGDPSGDGGDDDDDDDDSAPEVIPSTSAETPQPGTGDGAPVDECDADGSVDSGTGSAFSDGEPTSLAGNPPSARRGGRLSQFARSLASSEGASSPLLPPSPNSTLDDGATCSLEPSASHFDHVIKRAFMPSVHFPPSTVTSLPPKVIEQANKRLDRRTLYFSLLNELSDFALRPSSPPSSSPSSPLSPSSTSSTSQIQTSSSVAIPASEMGGKRWLRPEASRTLKSLVSLAASPGLRSHLHAGSLAGLFSVGDEARRRRSTPPTEDVSSQSSSPHEPRPGARRASTSDLDSVGRGIRLDAAIANGDDRDASQSGAATAAMQETVAMALSHAYGCPFLIMDNRAIANVRKALNATGQVEAESTLLKTSSIVASLIRIADQGWFEDGEDVPDEAGRLSGLMAADSHLLDGDQAAKESLDEQLKWEAALPKPEKSDVPKSSPLVIYIPAHAASSILRSRSAIDLLLREVTNPATTILLIMGHELDPHGMIQSGGMSRPPEGASEGASTSSQQQASQEGGNPFSSFFQTPGTQNSPFSLGGLPNLNNSQQQQLQKQPNPQFGQPFSSTRSFSKSGSTFIGGPHSPPNVSGVHDPEGSRRFNVFLTRSFGSETPGVVGAVAPPAAGNLFQHANAINMMSNFVGGMMGDGPDAKNKMLAMSSKLTNPNTPFFNSSQVQKFFKNMAKMSSANNMVSIKMTPKELHDALLAWLKEMSEDENGSSDQSVSKLFSDLLEDENMRVGIVQTLSKAAPALLDPRCMGVQLSVYVPPPIGHKNAGQMPHPNINGGKGEVVANFLANAVSLPSSAAINDPKQPANFSLPADLLLSSSDSAAKKGWLAKSSNRNSTSSALPAFHPTAAQSLFGARKNPQIEPSAKGGSSAHSPTPESGSIITGGISQKPTSSVGSGYSREQRHLEKLRRLCVGVPLYTPSDPGRAKAWTDWRRREASHLIFKKNRKALLNSLRMCKLRLGASRGLSSSLDCGGVLRATLSVRDCSTEMGEVVRASIEFEARRERFDKLLRGQSHGHFNLGESSRISVDSTTPGPAPVDSSSLASLTDEVEGISSISPSSIEAALASVCKVSAAPGALLGISNVAPRHAGSGVVGRTKEDIAQLVLDKHEKALVSQVVSAGDIGVTYDMIGGLQEVKELLRESVTYPLKFPHLYSEGIAKEAVKGVLLFGPPGTGKTLLAKAVATEGGATFLSIDASSIENKWLGESEKNAKAVFTLARRLAPCVVFIDEVDSLLSSREHSEDSAHGTLTSVKTTMMSEWDGLNSGTNGNGIGGSDRVVVIGSTNRPFDLDEAVLRRFPRRIMVDLPDLKTRQEILEVTMRDNRVHSSVNFTKIAEKLDGYTGSDIKEVCREAVVRISHEQASALDKGTLSISENFGRLREVKTEDFEISLKKLKKSVSEKGKELEKVWKWNEEYGEIKRKKKKSELVVGSMFL